MSFFQGLVLIIVLFFLAIIILMPTYIQLTKHTMYNEWKAIWNNEIEAKKRELAMREGNLQKMQVAKVGRKQKGDLKKIK